MSFDRNPWASGPKEILSYGINLLNQEDSDVKRRIAMIIIDNSVELMFKTYLGLPKRVSKLNISRAKYDEFSGSFPKLLDAMEEYASHKVLGLYFGEIEYYHRLRNGLYHDGNGLTVERQKVETYAIIAKIIFKNLFGFDLLEKSNLKNDLELDLEQYLELWGNFELIIQTRKKNYKAFEKSTIEILNELVEKKLIDESDLEIIEEYKNYRHKLVLSQIKVNDIPLPKKKKYVPYILNIITKIQGFEI